MTVLFLLGLWSFVMGTLIGSFLNVVVWRVPRGESVVSPPSHCPKCGHRIRPWENIPIISWLCLKGRCSACHLPISWKYPAGEAAVGFLFLAIARCVYLNQLSLWTVISWWWFAGTVLSIARIDWEHRCIPNSLTYKGMAVALLMALVEPATRTAIALPESLSFSNILTRPLVQFCQGITPDALGLRVAAVADCLCGILMGLIMLGIANVAGSLVLKLYKRHNTAAQNLPDDPIGWGDIKMLMMCGAFLGADACIYLLAGGTLLGFVGTLAWVIIRRRRNIRANDMLGVVPFGPFLAVPALLWVIAGNWMYLITRALTTP